MLNHKYLIVLWAVFALVMLWPASLVAAPPEPAADQAPVEALSPSQQSEPFLLYSSYEWTDKTGPQSCPPQDPFPIFRFGTRDVFNYGAITAKEDIVFGFLWYELDEEGQVVGEDPIAAVTAEAKAGDTLPFGLISFTQDVAGNVGVVMMSQNSAGDWDPVATGVFMLAAKGAKAPKPSECPLE